MSTVTDSSTLRGSEAKPSEAGPLRPRRLARSLWRRWNEAEPFVAPPRSAWPIALRRARVAGLCLLALQLIGLFWWSSVEAHAFALTKDFAEFEQAATLISRGVLDPHSTILGYAFWRDHSTFTFWPLGIIQALWPHPATLLWVQDAAAVAGEAIAFGWICEIVARRVPATSSTRSALALTGLGAALLVANPWVVWACSFDFHVQALSTLFLLAAARDLYRGKRRFWIWIALGLGCGDLGASYVGALGVSAIATGRCRAGRGAIIASIGLGWLLLIGAIHGDQGTTDIPFAILAAKGTAPESASALTVLKAIATHPGRVLAAIWANHLNLWANLSPSGAIGLLWLPLLVPLVLLLAESQLTVGAMFSAPGFQNLAVISLAAVGTVAICGSLLTTSVGRRLKWLLPTVCGALAANTIAWAVVWLPDTGSRWMPISPQASAALRTVRAHVGPRDEVIAEQGIAGPFADRAAVYLMSSAREDIPISARTVWILFAPGEGIETVPVANAYANIATIASQRGARLLTAQAGIWAFEWHPAAGIHRLVLGSSGSTIPAWTVSGPAGVPVRTGSVGDWHAAGNGKAGYVVDHAFWRRLPGRYTSRITLACSETANVEVWNSTTSTLLARASVPASEGKTTVNLSFDLKQAPAEHVYSGWGIWRTGVIEPTGDQVEIRVFSPGGTDQVDVYDLGLQRTG